MGINPVDFRQLIVRPTLQKLGKWSSPLENLLVGTAAQASGLGIQLNSAFGFGLYQISANLHVQVWDCFFAFDADLASTVRGMASQRDFLQQPHLELTTNLRYATAVAWGVYALKQAEIPLEADNLDALSRCWHQYFCEDSTLTPRQFISTYQQLVEQEQAYAA